MARKKRITIPGAKQTSSGRWFIQLRLNGKSQYVYGATKEECEQEALVIKSQYKAGKLEIKNDAASITLREACQQYINKKEKAKRSPETVRGYDIIMRHRFQSVMDKPVSSIKNWQSVYDKEAEKYSAKTMKNTWSLIQSAVKSECKIDLPTIEQISEKKTEHAFLTPDEIKVFIKAAENDKYKIALFLALCSCRVSEIFALDWPNVDLKNKAIHIKGAVVRNKNNTKVEKKENKTEAGERTIPIMIPELEAALKAETEKTGKVIVANENTLLKHSNMICDAAGLPRVGMHGLRHSFASLCYSLEVPVKITMQVGGWKDLNTVMKIYTHLAKKDVGKQVEKLTNFYRNA